MLQTEVPLWALKSDPSNVAVDVGDPEELLARIARLARIDLALVALDDEVA